jgi:hypothetical protein
MRKGTCVLLENRREKNQSHHHPSTEEVAVETHPLLSIGAVNRTAVSLSAVHGVGLDGGVGNHAFVLTATFSIFEEP